MKSERRDSHALSGEYRVQRNCADRQHHGLEVRFPPGRGRQWKRLGITNNRSTGRSQSFTYDALNRISTGQSSATSGSACWGQSFGIDPWGNMTSETTTKCSAGLLSTTASVKNQLVGYGYDAAGNLTQEGSGSPSWTYTYDAENRISSIAGSASETFKYDGDGERVYKSYGAIFWRLPGGPFLSKATLSGTINSEHIYFGGRHIAIVNGTTPSYLFPDHLGGEHVVTNASGTICNDVDTLPFGGEIDYTASCGPSYVFAGMDRGNENSSDLDYDINRYYDLRVGRFMTPDEPLYDGDYDDPQELNLYNYTRNNPLDSIDPNGHSVSVCDTNGQHCTSVSNDAYAQAQQQDQYNHAPTLDQLQKTEGEAQNITDSNGNVVGTATRINDENAPVEGITPLGESYLGQYALGAGFGKAIGWGWRGIAGMFGRGAGSAATDAASETINLADQKATTHILDGDATGGGHAPGTGIVGKSEFPAGWGSDKIMHEISDVATDPASKVTTAGRSTIIEGTREGVNIRVVIRDGRIVTGYPTNLPRNP